jgi:CrcB protein
MAPSELFLRAQVSIEMIRGEPQPRQLQVQPKALRALRQQVLQPRLQLQRQQVRQAQVLKFGLSAAIGAAIGSLARLQISYWFQTPSETSFPWATFAVNVIGALLIGLVATSQRIVSNENRRHFVVTGLLGGFTTFSAIAVETLQLANSPFISATYVVGTFAIGVAATHIGSLLGKQQ